MAIEKKCDCTKVPFSSACVEECIEHVLSNATIEEKQLILGFSPSLAHNIRMIYKLRRVESLDDLIMELKGYETDELWAAFSRLTQYQLNYFNKSQQERRTIIETIKRLNLDNDENLNMDRPLSV